MHSTPCDLSPRPCPPPWCPLQSGPCWSSRGRRGRRGNKTTRTLTSLQDNTTSPSPAGGDVFKSVKSLNSEGKPQTDRQIGVDGTFLSLNLFCLLFLCGRAPGVSVDIPPHFPLSWCFSSRHGDASLMSKIKYIWIFLTQYLVHNAYICNLALN